MTHIEIVRTEADQPWHVRIRADNGEPTWSTENYTTLQSALDAIELLGRTFSPIGLASESAGLAGRLVQGQAARYLTVWYDSDELGAKVTIPVRYVDERPAS